jgi:hypothetical protein
MRTRRKLVLVGVVAVLASLIFVPIVGVTVQKAFGEPCPIGGPGMTFHCPTFENSTHYDSVMNWVSGVGGLLTNRTYSFSGL